MKKETVEKASKILEQIKIIRKEIENLKLHENGINLMRNDINGRLDFIIWFDREEIQHIVECKQQRIQALEKELEAL